PTTKSKNSLKNSKGQNLAENNKNEEKALSRKKRIIHEEKSINISDQKLIFEEIWLKNRRDLVHTNIVSINDLYNLLHAIEQGKIKIKYLSKTLAASLIQELFWLSLISSFKIRECIIKSIKVNFNKIKIKSELEKIRKTIIKCSGLERKEASKLAIDIIKKVSSKKNQPFSGDALLIKHPQLSRIFRVNPISEIGKGNSVVFQLINQTKGNILTNYKLHIKDVSIGNKPKEIGDVISDESGLAVIFLPENKNQKDKELKLEIQVFDDKSKLLLKTNEQIPIPQKVPYKLVISSAEKDKKEEITIIKLNTDLNYQFPNKLLTSLNNKKVKSLYDIRRLGSLKKIDEININENQNHIKILEAHANLMDITTDLKEQKKLIKKEFLSPQSIARTPFKLFTSKMQKDLGEVQSIILHRIARAQTNYLQNVLTNARTNLTNLGEVPDWHQEFRTLSGIDSLFDEECECKDCDAAVSPRAYLADLIDYAIQHIYNKTTEEPIDLEFIDSSLYQPIGNLPASCEAISNEVRQVRICIEVLRSYLKDCISQIDDSRWASWRDRRFLSFIESQNEYNLNIYSTLLNKIGTSYTEIRQVLTASDEWMESLANRLGIPTDILPSLVLNPNSEPGRSDYLDELNIERLFGLSDTRRNPLAEGAKINDHRHGGLSDIQLQGVIWNENTDINGIIYANLLKVSNTQYEVELFKDKERTSNVAYGMRATPSGEIILDERNGSGINGRLSIHFDIFQRSNSDLEISTNPYLSSWLNGQIKHWQFENVEWNRNTDEIGSVYIDLKRIFNPRNINPLSYRVRVYRHDPLSNRYLVASGSRYTPKGTIVLSEKNNSGLTGEVKIDYVADNSAIRISLVPLILAARQKYLREIWKEQDWPADLPDTNRPLIDPDLIGPQDFRTPLPQEGPEHPANAFDLWIRRREWVDEMLLEFIICHVNGIDSRIPPFNSLLEKMKDRFAYGGNNYDPCWPVAYDINDLDNLYRDLKYGQNIDSTTSFIENDLNLSSDSFNRLIEIKNKDKQYHLDLRNEKVTEDEWNEVFSILVQARKKSLFTEWKREEENLNIPDNFGPELFWFSVEEPKEGDWPQNLNLPWPIIDPEFITQEELLETENSNTKIRLWQARKAQLELHNIELKEVYWDNDFETMLLTVLGDPDLPLTDLELNDLLLQLDDTDPTIVEQAEQVIASELSMSGESFRIVFAIRNRINGGGAVPSEAELDQVCIILTRVRKIRQSYPVWLIEEKLPKIDPDVIKLDELSNYNSVCNTRKIWNARKGELESNLNDLVDEHARSGFDALLSSVLGGSFLSNLRDLNDDLQSADNKVKNLSIGSITETYFLTVEQFDRIYSIKDKLVSGDATNMPTADEYNEVYKILQEVQKSRDLLSRWIEQEDYLHLTYWNVYKTRVPHWRASCKHRQQWQHALQVRYQPPIIEPDIIGFGDLRNWPVPDTASGLLNTRNTELINRLTELADNKTNYTNLINRLYAFDRLLTESIFNDGSRNNTQVYIKALRESSDFDTVLWLIFKYISVPTQFDEIYDYLENVLGEYLSGIDERVKKAKLIIREKLFLPEHKFERLMEIKEKEALSESITDAEWDEVDEILNFSWLVSRVMGLEHEQNLGFDITSRVEQFGLSYPAFSRLTELRNLLVLDADIQNSEWSDIYSILLQVEKMRNNAIWRNQEKNANIVLSQDFFKIPGDEITELLTFEPIVWRSTLRDRRDWTRKLETRMEQEETIITSMREIISSTEEISLPLLRDSLINMTIQPSIVFGVPEFTFEEQQQWLSDTLIIDTKTGGCQITTRTSQAITTIQNLIWLIRTGQFKGTVISSDIELELSSENFDEEWKWMGSYATWRAAMFVFMYPENILLPNLRKSENQSPVFKEIVSLIGNSNRFSPEMAIDTAKLYSEYFKDICNLQTQATCYSSIKVLNEELSDTILNFDMLFMFAKS
ncbi:MAG: neuraminidase-like domain-containing protein, partial [Candidatus Thorarchaeota archaeon]